MGALALSGGLIFLKGSGERVADTVLPASAGQTGTGRLPVGPEEGPEDRKKGRTKSGPYSVI